MLYQMLIDKQKPLVCQDNDEESLALAVNFLRAGGVSVMFLNEFEDQMKPFLKLLAIDDEEFILSFRNSRDVTVSVLTLRTTSKDKVLVCNAAYFRQQIAIYRTLGLTEWANILDADFSMIMNRLKKNSGNVDTRLKAGMIPILMPGRLVQNENWLTSFNLLQPYFRTGGLVRKADFSAFAIFDQEQYGHIFSQSMSWNHIPQKSYIFWTKPSEYIDPEIINESVEQQMEMIQQAHGAHPELYAATDIHPLEYASLQVLYTYGLYHARESSEDITPLDNSISFSSPFCRFVFLSLMHHKELTAYFSTPISTLKFTESSRTLDGGFRLVGRL